MDRFKWEIITQENTTVEGTDNLPNNIFVAKDDLNSKDRPRRMTLEVNNKVYGVDLFDGKFLKEGVWVQHPNMDIEPEHYRLIFFKRIRKLIAEIPMKWSDGSGGFTEIGSITNIHIGWQTTINGTNHKRIMIVSPTGEMEWISE